MYITVYHCISFIQVTLEVVLQGSLGVIDGGVHVVNEVCRHQLLISEGEDALPEWFGC